MSWDRYDRPFSDVPNMDFFVRKKIHLGESWLVDIFTHPELEELCDRPLVCLRLGALRNVHQCTSTQHLTWCLVSFQYPLHLLKIAMTSGDPKVSPKRRIIIMWKSHSLVTCSGQSKEINRKIPFLPSSWSSGTWVYLQYDRFLSFFGSCSTISTDYGRFRVIPHSKSLVMRHTGTNSPIFGFLVREKLIILQEKNLGVEISGLGRGIYLAPNKNWGDECTGKIRTLATDLVSWSFLDVWNLWSHDSHVVCGPLRPFFLFFSVELRYVGWGHRIWICWMVSNTTLGWEVDLWILMVYPSDMKLYWCGASKICMCFFSVEIGSWNHSQLPRKQECFLVGGQQSSHTIWV